MPYQTKPFTFHQWLENLLTYVISHMERWKRLLVAQEMPVTVSPPVEEIAESQELPTTQQQAVEQDAQASPYWQILQGQVEEEPQIVEAVADIQPRPAYVPGNIRDIPLLNTNKELVAQYLEQHRSTVPSGDSDDSITYLMGLADRFHCTIEMATFLAMMSIGGPQRLLRKDAEWDATTRQAVHQLHSALRKSCTDDLEFALKLYAAWSLELPEEHVFIQPSALAHTWHQRRVPALSTEMHTALNTRMNTFLQAVLQATTFAQIRALVEHYEIKGSADHWLQETEKVFFSARQEAWASTFFINYGLFRSKVEPERERLLRVLEINKKTLERRPLQFDLLHKVRLLFAFAKAQRKDIPSYQIRIDSDVERRFYQTPPSYIELARFLAEKTRTNQETLIPTFTTSRLFLDQAIPLGSRYRCRVSTAPANGKALVQLSERIAEPPAIQERFRTFIYYTNDKNSTATPILQAMSAQRSLAPATPTLPAVSYTPLYRANTIAGLLDISSTHCTIGDELEVAVTDYLLDEFSHPYVIVTLPPKPSRFELFCQRYQVGDSPDVTVYGYEDYTSDPTHPRVALLVREQVSLLEITVEPEHISFFDLGETIKEIPVGTTLRLPINDIDREREVVTFSSLSLVELHLNIQLNKHSAGLQQKDGPYEIDATIRGEAPNNTLLLELPWHAPTAESGLVYIIPTTFNADELALYQLGDKVKVRLSFPERSSSNLLLQFPHEVSQAIDLQTGTQRLFWQQYRLHFPERMPYATYYYFSTLSSDPAYQQALLHLYRATHQFTLEVVALNPTTNLLTAGDEAAPTEDLLEELLQTNRSGLSSTLDHAPSRREKSPLSYYETETRAIGRVTSVKDFGAFVEIEPGVEGLIHKSKMWGYVTDARNVLQPDDQVEVLILGLNDEGDKLELSMHIPELNPLLDYQEGDTVQGTITNVQEFGAFVDIAPGVSGFVPKSKMWGYVPDAREIVHVGQRIKAFVLEVSLEKSSLTLSMEVPENDPLNEYEAGQTVRGKITGIRHYGAFVAFDRSIKGLIHSHYISPNLVDARRSHLKVGDEVTVLIVRVNWEERNLELSLTDAY